MDRQKLRQRLLKIFFAELDDHVATLERGLGAWEKKGRDAEHGERVEVLHRAAHSLKGAARSAGVAAIERTAREIEFTLAALRDGRLTDDSRILPTLLSAVAALADAGRRGRSGQDLSGAPVENVFPRLQSLLAGGEPAAVAPEPVTAPAAKRRILIVDDSATNRNLERLLLEDAGFVVVEAVDGEEALRRARAEAVDVVLADINMPGMDGFTMTRAIRGAVDLRHLPVILLSGSESAEERERGLAVGANAYLGKGDAGQAELAVAIDRVLEAAR